MLISPPDENPCVSRSSNRAKGAATPIADHDGSSPMAAVAPLINKIIVAKMRRRPRRSARSPTSRAPTGLARNEVANSANTPTSPEVPDPGGRSTTASTEAIAP